MFAIHYVYALIYEWISGHNMTVWLTIQNVCRFFSVVELQCVQTLLEEFCVHFCVSMHTHTRRMRYQTGYFCHLTFFSFFWRPRPAVQKWIILIGGDEWRTERILRRFWGGCACAVGNGHQLRRRWQSRNKTVWRGGRCFIHVHTSTCRETEEELSEYFNETLPYIITWVHTLVCHRNETLFPLFMGCSACEISGDKNYVTTIYSIQIWLPSTDFFVSPFG